MLQTLPTQEDTQRLFSYSTKTLYKCIIIIITTVTIWKRHWRAETT